MADNKFTFRRLLRLYVLYAKMDVAWLLRDTKYCVLGIIADFIANASVLSSAFLIAERFGGFGGMNSNEVLFMLGYSTITTGFFLTFFNGNNVGHISRVIGRGQLDHKLIQPIPIKIQLMTEGFMPVSGSAQLWVGIAVCVIAIIRLDYQVSFGLVIMFIAFHLISQAIFLSMLYIPSVLAFYFPVAAEETATAVSNLQWQLSNYPLGQMPTVIKIALNTILPIGLTVWFPSLVLLGKERLDFGLVVLITATVGFSSLATILFKKGLKYYEKIGSQRYKDMGHRR